MPTDGLPFAIFIRRQVEFLGLAQEFAELRDLLLLSRRNNVDGLEIVFDIDTQISPFFLLQVRRNLLRPLGKIAHMPYAGFYRVVRSQESRDRPGLGRRLDNH